MSGDYTLHPKALRNKALRTSDFIGRPWLADEAQKEALFNRCLKVLDHGFASIEIAKSCHAGKDTFKIKSLEHELVLRLASRSVQKLTGVRQSNRVEIVRSLKVMLSEGVDYTVYRLDLKSFFENVNPTLILKQLEFDRGFSRQSLFILDSFFSHLSSLGISGLPRGIAISSILSEYALRAFDEHVRTQPNVFYYARFVDDIIIISSRSKQPKKQILKWRAELPNGLEFNTNKCCWIDCSKNSTVASSHHMIEYLGYQFEVTASPCKKTGQRQVSADIAVKKVSKLKTRIVLSAIQFCRDGNYDDFRDRIKLLCSNASVYDHSKGTKRKVGIYYNYLLVDGEGSKSLRELDDFLRKLLLGKAGKVSLKLNSKLSNAERRRLLTFSFRSGFLNKTHTHFPGARMAHLMRCWEHA